LRTVNAGHSRAGDVCKFKCEFTRPAAQLEDMHAESVSTWQAHFGSYCSRPTLQSDFVRLAKLKALIEATLVNDT
jgi:hypothetical protein